MTPMTSFGIFHTETIEKLNKLLQRYPLAPGHGIDDENTYCVGRVKKGVVEDWYSLDALDGLKWEASFNRRWDEIKEMKMFTGRIFALESPRTFPVGEGRWIDLPDRVVRGFKWETSRTVLEILGQAYYVLYDPSSDDTFNQGVIGRVYIKKGAEIPTLVFE
jgi:hypothetical protein